jgi:hypothetical protein
MSPLCVWGVSSREKSVNKKGEMERVVFLKQKVTKKKKRRGAGIEIEKC